MPSPSSVAFTWDVCNSGGLGLLVAVRAALLFGDDGCGRHVTLCLIIIIIILLLVVGTS